MPDASPHGRVIRQSGAARVGCARDEAEGHRQFPGELALLPRSTVAKSYDIVRWSNMAAGGHFAAMEQPALFAGELRAFLRDLDAIGAVPQR